MNLCDPRGVWSSGPSNCYSCNDAQVQLRVYTNIYIWTLWRDVCILIWTLSLTCGFAARTSQQLPEPGHARWECSLYTHAFRENLLGPFKLRALCGQHSPIPNITHTVFRRILALRSSSDISRSSLFYSDERTWTGSCQSEYCNGTWDLTHLDVHRLRYVTGSVHILQFENTSRLRNWQLCSQ